MDRDAELKSLNEEMNQLFQRLQATATRKKEILGFEKRISLYPVVSEVENRNFKFYHDQQRSLWTPFESKFGEDIQHYNKLSDDLKRLIDIPFGFFAGADADIIDELSFRFLIEAECYHELCFYLVQLYIESVHAETYALLISHLIEDDKKKDHVLRAMETMPIVKEIHEWMGQFMCGDFTDVERRCAAAIMEGIIFQAPFLFIFYFKTNGTMKNVRFLNQLISQDEGLHADKGCDFVKHWRIANGTGSDASFYKLVEEGRQLVRKFSLFVLTREIDGSFIDIPYLGKQNLLTYCDAISNRVLFQMGLKEVYEVDRSLIPEWMSDIGNTVKTNFYENAVGNYSQYAQADLEQDQSSDEDF